MNTITLWPQHIEDAQRFYDILNNEHFIFLDVRPDSVAAELAYLLQNENKRQSHREYNFSVRLNDMIVGAVGVKIHPERGYIGEIGYFIEELHWGRGFAVQAVQQLEEYCLNTLELVRIEVIMAIENSASERVAIKAGYQKEARMQHYLKIFGVWHDAFLYSKILS